MSTRRLNLFLAFSFLVSFQLSAQIDSVRFTTDDYVLGEISSMQKGVLTIETDYSDSDFTIEWKKVTGIFTETQFLVNLSNGDKHFGRLESQSETTVNIITEEEGTILVNHKDIVYLNAYDDKFLDRLSASISIGLDVAKARNLRQFSTRSSIGYKAEKWNTGASLYNLTSSQDETEDIKRTESDISFSYLLPYKLYGIATVSYLSNTEQSIASRINAQLGAGRYIVQNNDFYWGIKLGANRNIERYSNETEDRESWEGYLGTELNIFDLGDLDLLLSLMAYPGITESGRWRTDTKFDVKYEFPMDFFIKFGFSLNYDNLPAEGASETDYIFNIGVGWDW
ncbi:MAG: DUF481 domain-containing protein [Bacteroidota bacterium]